jgi:alpha-galactosidase
MNLETPLAPGKLHPSLQNIAPLATHQCGDIEIVYWHDTKSGSRAARLHPAHKRCELAAHRASIDDAFEIALLPDNGWKPAPFFLDSLVQVKVRGEDYPWGFVSGVTMRNAACAEGLKLVSHEKHEADGRVEIVTRLESTTKKRFACEHRLWWFEDEGEAPSGFRVATTFENLDSEPLDLEFLSSFSLAGLSPFAEGDTSPRLRVHRARSWWSAEGRLESRALHELHLEPAWASGPPRCERFGQVGSLPVRGWFPFVAVEDTQANVTWGAQLAWLGSWQIELYRRDDFLSISGGLADRQFGHWLKSIAPGERFTSPEALISCAVGDVDEVCHRLTRLHRRALQSQPAPEREMPLACNDWCTHWADTNHEKIVAMAQRLKGSPVKYLVIDDGWQDRPGEGAQMIGDWDVHPTRFPNLRATCDAIRENGLVPGIWFEFEGCTSSARAWNETDHFLQRDGEVLQVGSRRFWDFRDPWTIEYLSRKVIGLLRDCGFGYLKVDYNDSIGWGVDGAESSGEGLRAHLEGVRGFFQKIRAELPDLVIENCSSGGHRLEPSMLEICAQASFSDAHESREIPIIAANLHRLMLPQQSQIWAVLHAADSMRRISYSLAAGFLGRLCLSGEIAQLSHEQMSLASRAMDFYGVVAPLIRDGKSRRFGPGCRALPLSARLAGRALRDCPASFWL